MNAVVRVLLMWLLAVALPVQGVAAATMQFCGAAHHPQKQQVQGADHGHGAAHAEADGHHVGAAGPAGEASAASDLSPHGQQKCSACAACCAGSALPPAALVLPVVEPASECVTVVPSAYVGPDVAGLEKPPRSNLA